jgi:TP901 family phage tail tape measure protein
MTEVASAFVRIRPNMAGFKAETQAGMRAAFGGVAAAAAGAGVAVAGIMIAKSTITAAKGFESQLELIKTQAGASSGELRQMHGELVKMASQVGSTPEELAKGLYHIESAGIHGAAALKALRAAAEGAAVGHTDLESVTNALVAATNSHIGGITSQVQSMGVLNAIVGAGNMRMGDLTAAMSTGILPAAHTFGLRIQDVGAALATMTNAGVPAIDAATRLRMTFSLLAAPTGKAAKELASIGLTSKELATTMREKGLLPALTELKAHLDASGKSLTDQAALLSHAFGGGRSSGAIMTLLGNLDSYQGRLEQITKTTGNFGTAWADTQKSAEFQQNKFGASISALKIMIGDQLLPAFTTAVAKLTDWTTRLSQSKRFHDDLHAALRLLGDALAVIGGILKTVAGLFQDVTGALGGTKNAVILLFAVLAIGKFVAIAAAIRTYLIAQGAQLLAREFQVATAEVEASFGAMELATIGLSTTIKAALISTGIGALIVAAGIAAMLIITHWNTVKKWISDFGIWIKDHAYALLALPLVGQTAFVVIEVIKHWTAIKNFVTEFARDLALLFTHPVAAIVKLFRLLKHTVIGIFKSLAGVIGGFLAAIPTSIMGIHIPGASEVHSYGTALKAWADGGAAVGAAFGANLALNVSAGAALALKNATLAMSAVNALTGTGAVGSTTVGKGSVQPAAHFAATHHTEGFPGAKLDAVDIMAKPGTRVLAPQDGVLTRTTGSAPTLVGANINGYSLYFVGADGTAYFMTHLATVVKLGNYRKGDTLATVAAGTAGGAHVHVSEDAPIDMAHGASTSRPPAPGENTATAATKAATDTSMAALLAAIKSGSSATPVPGGSDSKGKAKTAAAKAAAAAAAISSAKESLSEHYKALTAHAEVLGKAMSAAVRSRLADIHSEIQNIVTKADVTTAKEKLAALARTVAKELADVRTRIALAKTFDALKTQVKSLGSEVTPQIAAAMTRISGEIASRPSLTDIAKINRQMTQVKAAIKARLTEIHRMIQQQQAAFGDAWTRMTSAADSSFDRTTAKMLKNLQVMVNAASGAAFLFGGAITKTPAEILLAGQTPGEVALAAVAAAHDAAQAQMDQAEAAQNVTKALADQKTAQNKLDTARASGISGDELQGYVDAVTGAGDSVLSSQKRVDELTYQRQQAALEKQATLERAALQAQADLERAAADQQLSDAQTALTESRTLLKTQMDDRLYAIQTGMADGTIAAADGMVALVAALTDPQYGVDIETGGLVIGAQLYSGLSKSFGPIFDLIHELQAQLKAVGELAPAGTLTVKPPATKQPPDVIERLLRDGNTISAAIRDAINSPPAGIVPGTNIPLVNAVGQPLTPLEIARAAAR